MSNGEPTDVAEGISIPSASLPSDDSVNNLILLADLQRLQADFANYRKRTAKEKDEAYDTATARVLTELLPLLDNVDLAKSHNALSGGFKALADQLESLTAKLGLAKFGSVGSIFNPHVHEALSHEVSDVASAPTVMKVFRVGYSFQDKILRPAQVAVVEGQFD